MGLHQRGSIARLTDTKLPACEADVADEPSAFSDAKSKLFSTINAAGAARGSSSRGRESRAQETARFLERLQLDLSGLSVIHVTGTKGKGSTCALVESILRHSGFRTGLFTSPHLLEVTERIKLDGRPIAEEAFAGYFFQVWNRLQATRKAGGASGTGGRDDAVGAAGVAAEPEVAEMPGYFTLLTLVGLWCFVQEAVDVCIIEVGVGGRDDATNVVPPPVACGITLLDLDHTEVLGDTLDKIAWHKGGIFKRGSQAYAVKQDRGGMSVLRQCAEQVGCELHVVRPLPARDAAGVPYAIGLSGEHQRTNAALALELCSAWVNARRRASSRGVVAGGITRGTNVDDPGFPEGGPASAPLARSSEPTVDQEFSTSEAVHRGLRECNWPGRCQVFRPPSQTNIVLFLDGAHTEQSMHACLRWYCEEVSSDGFRGVHVEQDADTGDTTRSDPGHKTREARRWRAKHVLWFNTSHERDVVPLLEPLASARAARVGGSCVEVLGGDGTKDDGTECRGQQPLFDEVWFMEVKAGRPSRARIPTAPEILRSHGLSFATREQGVEGPGGVPEHEMTTWQQTLEQVWVALQSRAGGATSATGTGTPSSLLQNLERHRLGGGEREDQLAESREMTELEGERAGDAAPIYVLCTGSLYVVAEVLQMFRAEVM